MNPKLLHNLTTIPFLIMGMCAFLLGLVWLLSSEPWMLDKAANTILLDESYEHCYIVSLDCGYHPWVYYCYHIQ